MRRPGRRQIRGLMRHGQTSYLLLELAVLTAMLLFVWQVCG